jgi:hypothetical protein
MPAKVQTTPALPGLSPVCGKPIIAHFDGGQLSSDGGVLALREIETRLGLANRLAACIADPTLHVVYRHRNALARNPATSPVSHQRIPMTLCVCTDSRQRGFARQ